MLIKPFACIWAEMFTKNQTHSTYSYLPFNFHIKAIKICHSSPHIIHNLCLVVETTSENHDMLIKDKMTTECRTMP